MRSPLVVPLNPLADRRLGFSKAVKAMLPHAFLFETTKESFDDPVLLRSVRSDELLRQPVILTSRPEPAALKDQSVVASDHRSFTYRSQGAEASDASLLDGSLGFFGMPAQGELPAQQLPIVTVDHPNQVGPAIPTTIYMRQIHRPAAIAFRSSAHRGFHPRSGAHNTLMHQPALGFQNPVNPFPVGPYPQAVAKPRPQPSIPIGGMLPDQHLQRPLQLRGISGLTLRFGSRRNQTGAST